MDQSIQMVLNNMKRACYKNEYKDNNDEMSVSLTLLYKLNKIKTTKYFRMKFFCLLLGCMVSFLPALAQKGNNEVRKGNKLYSTQDYKAATKLYNDALKKNPKLFDAAYDLGNADYRQKNYKEALAAYQKALPLTKNKVQIAHDFHNVGNALMNQKQYEDALKAYRTALLANPNDNETRFNYAYAAEMLKQQQNKNNKNNKDQKNQQNKQNKQDQKNQPNKQNNNDKNKQDKNKQNQDQQQPQGGGMSKQNADQILNAIQQEENQVQDKINQQRVQMHSQNPAKNW
jgi:tetratricopeptide (TPR) repeat protein